MMIGKHQRHAIKSQAKRIEKALKAFGLNWTPPSFTERPMTAHEADKLLRVLSSFELDLTWIIDDVDRGLPLGSGSGDDYVYRVRITMQLIREYHPAFPTFNDIMTIPADQWPTIDEDGQIVPKPKKGVCV